MTLILTSRKIQKNVVHVDVYVFPFMLGHVFGRASLWRLEDNLSSPSLALSTYF